MGEYVYEGVVLPESGYEEDYLRTEENGGDYLGICRLVERASEVKITPNINTAFYLEAVSEVDEEDSQRDRAAYRAETGHQYPPVFRVRIAVTAEECSAEETAAFWKRMFSVGEQEEEQHD